MRTWKLFTVAGIAVRLHPTFLLLLVWILAVQNLEGASGPAMLEELLFIGALFACVVLHEFGHAVMALHFGVRTRDITLLPIGGVARMDSIPRSSWQELLIALAGPAVNAAIALLLAVWVTPAVLTADPLQLAFLPRLLVFNVVMAVFNLLPAFPMDGGRVLRAGLAMLLGYGRATAIAAALGQILAGGLALLGLAGNPFLVLLGVFVWLGATQEAQLVEVHEALRGLPVARWMTPHVRTLGPEQTLKVPLELMLTSFQREFPVVEGGRLAGMLARPDIHRALLRFGPDAPVGLAMRPAVAVEVEETLDVAFDRLLAAETPALPVVSDGKVVGLLTAERLAELVALRATLQELQSQSGRQPCCK